MRERAAWPSDWPEQAMEKEGMLTEAVRRFTEEHALLPEGARVVAGLSGGVDSVVLVHVLRALGYAVTAAHVNYGLRPSAVGDEALAHRLCASFGPPVPLRTAARDVEAHAENAGASLQAAARRQRYAFFRDVAREAGARHVATGHHRDDQAETLLLNLARGSGPEGLAGMRPKRVLEEGTKAGTVKLVRPLLNASREEIEAYARVHDLPFRRDPSNRDARFKRAALRRDVLPALDAHFPGAPERLARAAALMRAYVDDTLRPEVERRFEEARRSVPDGGALGSALRVEALRVAAPIWRGRLLLEGLRRWCPGAPRTQAASGELAALLDAQPGRYVAFGTARVWRERETLRFVRDDGGAAAATEPHSLGLGRSVRFPAGTVRAEEMPVPPERLDAGPHVALLDARRLTFPLAVRPWRDGDRFQPLGMSGRSTLVSDLLTDAKVPPSERRRVLVVCCVDRIVWVVGHRLAHPARVRGDTRRTVRLVFEPAR